MTAVVADAGARPFVHQGGVRHTRSSRQTAGASATAPEQKVGGAGHARRAASSPAVRSRAISGLSLPAGRDRLAAARTGKWGPRLPTSPARHKARQTEIGLRQRFGERRGEHRHAPASADEVEARDVTGEHGGMTLAGAQLDPDPQQHAGTPGAEPGRQDDGVAQGPCAQEDGGRTLASARARPPHRSPATSAPWRNRPFHGEAG